MSLVQCHVRVKIALPVYGNWMLVSPCRNVSADGAALSKGSRLFHSLIVYGKKEHWKAKILALGCSSVASPICQEGQSERTFLIFPFSSPISPLFSWFSWFFPIFGTYFAVRDGTLPPLTPPVATPLLGWMYFWLWPLKESMFLLFLMVR